MPDLLVSSNSLPLLRRLAAATSACLGALVLTACEQRGDSRSVAADCVRSLSTLAPIMGGGRTACAAMPAAVAVQAPVVRTATAVAALAPALIASAR